MAIEWKQHHVNIELVRQSCPISTHHPALETEWALSPHANKKVSPRYSIEWKKQGAEQNTVGSHLSILKYTHTYTHICVTSFGKNSQEHYKKQLHQKRQAGRKWRSPLTFIFYSFLNCLHFVLPYTCVTFVIEELILKDKYEYWVANGKCVWYYLKWPKQKDKTECVLCRQHRCVQRVLGDKGNPAASGLHSGPCPSSPGSPSSPHTSASSLSTNTQSGVSSLRQTKNATTPLAPRLSYSFHSLSKLASIPPLSG